LTLSRQGLNQYIVRLAESVYTRGFELPTTPAAEIDEAGYIHLSVIAVIDDKTATATLNLDEVWHPLPSALWQRNEYTYDLVDRGRQRRRAFHSHDRDVAEARTGSAAVHEHCEEVLGQAECAHYIGRELPNGYWAIDLLLAAWLEPAELGCSALDCLDRVGH